MAHKRNLRNSTRFDLKTKNNTTEKNVVVQNAWLLQIYTELALWYLLLKIDTQTNQDLKKFWRWFHSKCMHQLILIIFLISVLRTARCSVRIAHFFCNIYLFFLFLFFNWSFFVLLLTPQSTEIQRLRIFLCFLFYFHKAKQICENKGILKSGNKNRMIYQQKHNGISVMKFVWI